jgi:NADH dehydrogenase/NADH oxidase (H2O2-forming)
MTGSATKAGEFFIGGSDLKEEEARRHVDVITGYAEFSVIFPIMPDAGKVRLKHIADLSSGRSSGCPGQPPPGKMKKPSPSLPSGTIRRPEPGPSAPQERRTQQTSGQ